MAVKSSKKLETLVLCDDCKCCPVVENLSNVIVVTDDDGNTIRLTPNQFKILISRGNEIL